MLKTWYFASIRPSQVDWSCASLSSRGIWCSSAVTSRSTGGTITARNPATRASTPSPTSSTAVHRGIGTRRCRVSAVTIGLRETAKKSESATSTSTDCACAATRSTRYAESAPAARPKA